MNCGVCGHGTEYFSSAKMLRKHDVKYYRCPSCGFVQTESPYWLDEAYSSAIADSDIGLIGRNIRLSGVTSALLKIALPRVSSFLDWGGGYGVLTRLMRDAGFAFEWYDKYCDNLFANGFEKSKEHYDVITAFELMEHLPDPMNDLSEIMTSCDNLICTTALLPSPAPKPGEWWYYSLTTGQHISFYTREAMKVIADKFGRYYTNYGSIHVFSRQAVSRLTMITACRLHFIVNRLYKRRSLLWDDYALITSGKLS